MYLDLRDFIHGDEKVYNFNSQLEKDDSKYRIDDLNLIFPIEFNGSVYKFETGLELVLNISYSYATKCDRCLKDLVLSRNTEYRAYNMEREDEDLDYFQMDDGRVFLDDLIISQIIMDRPFKNICDEDCKGLCPKCGNNLNESSCTCEDEEQQVDPRFAKLKQLFDQEVE